MMQSIVRRVAVPLAHGQQLRPLTSSACRRQADQSGQSGTQRFNRLDGAGRGQGQTSRFDERGGRGLGGGAPRRRTTDHVNRIELIGHLAQPPAIKQTPNGKEFASFNVITNRLFERGDGALIEEKEMHVCSSHKLGQVNYVMGNLNTGSKVYVLGALRYDSVPSVRGDANSPMIRQAHIFVDLVNELAKSAGAGGMREDRSGEGSGGGSQQRGHDIDDEL
uniref:Uncharacterized protein n=1 Tax=Plectus sambesii TaxID=2011161 RepID=A0A914UHL6_9BILA